MALASTGTDESDGLSPITEPMNEVSGRIVARRLVDGRTEFGFQPKGEDRILPRSRFFPANASIGRWLQSSPVTVAGQEIGRISAACSPTAGSSSPYCQSKANVFCPGRVTSRPNARVDRWLRSSVIEDP